MVTEELFEATFMRMLDRIDLDELAVKAELEPVIINQSIADPFEQAEYLYSISEVDDFDYLTDKLLTTLMDRPTEFDGDFMRRIIKSIKVAKNNTATFEFINSKTIIEELKTNGS